MLFIGNKRILVVLLLVLLGLFTYGCSGHIDNDNPAIYEESEGIAVKETSFVYLDATDNVLHWYVDFEQIPENKLPVELCFVSPDRSETYIIEDFHNGSENKYLFKFYDINPDNLWSFDGLIVAYQDMLLDRGFVTDEDIVNAFETKDAYTQDLSRDLAANTCYYVDCLLRDDYYEWLKYDFDKHFDEPAHTSCEDFARQHNFVITTGYYGYPLLSDVKPVVVGSGELTIAEGVDFEVVEFR